MHDINYWNKTYEQSELPRCDFNNFIFENTILPQCWSWLNVIIIDSINIIFLLLQSYLYDIYEVSFVCNLYLQYIHLYFANIEKEIYFCLWYKHGNFVTRFSSIEKVLFFFPINSKCSITIFDSMPPCLHCGCYHIDYLTI